MQNLPNARNRRNRKSAAIRGSRRYNIPASRLYRRWQTAINCLPRSLEARHNPKPNAGDNDQNRNTNKCDFLHSRSASSFVQLSLNQEMILNVLFPLASLRKSLFVSCVRHFYVRPAIHSPYFS
jgi:hypothetical protein